VTQEYIEIRGARENNLKNVSVQIPKRKITIFTGVSGSGKSSIVFDTIATEAQRLLHENFSLFVRSFLPRYSQPDADAIENLSMAIVVDQKRLGGGAHSTLGTITDIYTVLRLLFSRVGQPFVGHSNAFSFNDPQGVCPDCNGVGRKINVDLDVFLDRSKSLNEGAMLFPSYAVNSWDWTVCTQSGLFDNDKKLADYSAEEMELLLYGKPYKVETTVAGKRFKDQVLAYKLNNKSITDVLEMTVQQALDYFDIEKISTKLQAMSDVGLDYLALGQPLSTLSGGECQRIKLAGELHKKGSMYVMDEPTTGLHKSDISGLLAIIDRLVDRGNTVIVIEHNLDIIKNADWIIDLGPEGGHKGGRIMYEGTLEQLLNAKHSLTSAYLCS
jgi:excinuclease UvrABC ATPase subunit